MKPSARLPARLLLLLLLAVLSPAVGAYGKNRVATDANGQPVRISGSVVIVEPNIELSEVLAGGVEEPRQEWSQAARRLYPAQVRQRLSAGGALQVPDYDVPDN